MNLLGKNILHDFKERHADARSQVGSWEQEVEKAEWNTPHELKSRFPKASLLKNQQVVFDICYNKYRILTLVNYKNKIVLVKNAGTHKEYDNWNVN